jgi:hypothetical protein
LVPLHMNPCAQLFPTSRDCEMPLNTACVVQNMLHTIIAKYSSLPELRQTTTLALNIWSAVEVSIACDCPCEFTEHIIQYIRGLTVVHSYSLPTRWYTVSLVHTWWFRRLRRWIDGPSVPCSRNFLGNIPFYHGL